MDDKAKAGLAIIIVLCVVLSGCLSWVPGENPSPVVLKGYGRNIYAGDLNGDGYTDVVDDGAQILLNDHGKFKSERFSGLGAIQVSTVEDIDNDGKAEIIAISIGSFNPTLYIGKYLGNGLVNFTKDGNLTDQYLVAIDDTDKDGKMEYISHVDLANNTDMGYPNTYPHLDTGLADFDGDNDTDIVYTLGRVESLYLFENDGHGNLTFKKKLYVGNLTGSVAVGDFNNDGRPDIIGQAGNANKFVVFMNQGNWNFTSKSYDDHGGTILRLIDIENDGDDDLIVGSLFGNSIVIWINDGQGSFKKQASYDLGGNLYESHSAVIIDIDKDGYMDFVGMTFGTGVHIVILMNDHKGRFT